MSAGAIIAIVAAAIVVFAVVLVITTARRADQRAATGVLSRETRKRDRGAVAPAEAPATSGKDLELAASAARKGAEVEVAAPSAPAPFTPIDPETVGFNRRQFLNRGIITMMQVSLAGFGAAVLAFLWPKLSGGFGSKINIGKVADVKAAIGANSGFYYVPEGRAWITAYPPDGLPKAKTVYPADVYSGMEQGGIVALYQKCVHLGCRVPQCVTSQWFECPCHGSQYNRVGEKKGGPAPRGLDRFAVEVSGGEIIINTGVIELGPPIGTNTTGQEAEGPHCISGGEGGH